MNLIASAVARLEETVKNSGCDEGSVSLTRNPKLAVCQYPRGVCVEACFGDRRGHVVTPDPIQACTKVSFMFGAPLNSPVERTAACAIVNAVTAFFCINRRVNPCEESRHAACLSGLAQALAGARVYAAGDTRGPLTGITITEDPADADVLLVVGPGLISNEGLAAVEEALGKKRVICLGPSTAGVATLLGIEHWCPYGH
ncbi:hypothetical protein Metli_2395 [Methanofollis liminatans DSM 4140]|uniref:Uncharacterized protein n=1 Tax=Methanofollis liminatans DSM 4140 TaxID=28892 RepID=J1ATB5_9EURY|nr:hypothetical protein [Methanofollis liminatans]EJG08333.1 hypothetical protein Metli_2395 [Methanofollis liminatans DSM 4140]